MESHVKISNVINSTDFVQEVYAIAKMFDEEFATIVQDGSIKRHYANVIQKNHLTDEDLKFTDITDYLVENEDGKVQIGDKMYYYPPYMFNIINDLVKRVVAVRCDKVLHYAKTPNSVVTQEIKSDFKTQYYVKLKKVLGLLRQNLKFYNNETKRMVEMTDKNIEEFKLRQIRGGILLACLDYYQHLSNISLSK